MLPLQPNDRFERLGLSQLPWQSIFAALTQQILENAIIMSGQLAETPVARPSNRNEIESNLLADRLERAIIRSKPFIPWVIGGLLALIAAGILIAVISRQAAEKEASGWTEIYFSQMRPDQLEMVTKNYQGTTAALWASQASADATLERALTQVYVDRSISTQLISEAQDQYEQILREARDPLLVTRARLALAKSYDAQAKDDLAIAEYRKVLDSAGAHPQLMVEVNERIKFLQSPEGQQFLTWFKSNAPSAVPKIETAEDLNDLPDSPDLKFEADQVPTLEGDNTPTQNPPIKMPDAAE